MEFDHYAPCLNNVAEEVIAAAWARKEAKLRQIIRLIISGLSGSARQAFILAQIPRNTSKPAQCL
jgi:hypothetical protein